MRLCQKGENMAIKGMNEAKRKVLEELKKQMMSEDDMGLKDMLGSKVKKVTVVADSDEGLQKGLSKAQQIAAKRKEMLGEESEKEGGESEEMEDSEEMEGEECECGECPMCLKNKIEQIEEKLGE